ncbi:MAG: hypothetical protein JWO40_877 [Candidatus Doudnabacteria bacterium]|nr:hypothetical protein [Candidatus Doudnabacteria bacterium]
MPLFVVKSFETQKTTNMLLPDNIHPENTIYFNGAFVLKELQRQPDQGLLDLYENVKRQRNLSFPIFILCLDWLYLLGVAETNNQDKIKLCF